MKTITLVASLFVLSLISAHCDPPKSGQSLGTITTTDGKVYADAKLAVVEPDGISILYADGGAKIPFTSLSPETQKQFGYDPEKSAFYAREQQYLAEIDKLQQENAELRRRLNLASAPSQTANATAGPAEQPTNAASGASQQPTIAGFHVYFFELRSQSALVDGRVDQGYPKYKGGPFAGMKPDAAMVYAQQQWENLPPDQQMVYEQKAQAFGDPIAKEEALEAIRASHPQPTTQGVRHETVTDQYGNTTQVQVISQ
jgi:hypothetical protein